MFQRRTVFVIGAGASAPYAFPTGPQLLSQARGQSPNILVDMTASAISTSAANELLVALRDTTDPSIDAMLEYRPDLWPAGKRVISALLFEREYRFLTTVRDYEQDWFAWVVHRMMNDCANLEDFARNPVSFITFNYDRLLEHRLAHGLAVKYHVDVKKAAAVLEEIPIIHVHGSIGPLYSTNSPGSEPAIPFGGNGNARNEVLTAAMGCAERTIQIVHEAQNTSPQFEQARRRLQGAQQILCFGFGFAPSNVERLGLRDMSREAQKICSAYGMTHSEIHEYVRAAFRGHPNDTLEIADANESLLAILRSRVHIAR